MNKKRFNFAKCYWIRFRITRRYRQQIFVFALPKPPYSYCLLNGRIYDWPICQFVRLFVCPSANRSVFPRTARQSFDLSLYFCRQGLIKSWIYFICIVFIPLSHSVLRESNCWFHIFRNTKKKLIHELFYWPFLYTLTKKSKNNDGSMKWWKVSTYRYKKTNNDRLTNK